MKNVLIVEDNKKIRDFLKIGLKKINDHCIFYEAEEIQTAMQYSKMVDIHLFIIDILLKEENGLDFAFYLREQKKYECTNIVFCTAEPSKELYAFRRIHCYYYLIKPFGTRELIEIFTPLLREEKGNHSILLEGKNSILKIDPRDILYVEIILRKMYATTTGNERIRIYNHTLRRMNQLLGEDFIPCFRGVIINKNYIKRVDKNLNKVILKCEEMECQLALSENYKLSVIKEMQNACCFIR